MQSLCVHLLMSAYYYYYCCFFVVVLLLSPYLVSWLLRSVTRFDFFSGRCQRTGKNIVRINVINSIILLLVVLSLLLLWLLFLCGGRQEFGPFSVIESHNSRHGRRVTVATGNNVSKNFLLNTNHTISIGSKRTILSIDS